MNHQSTAKAFQTPTFKNRRSLPTADHSRAPSPHRARGTYSNSQAQSWTIIACAAAAVACIFLAQCMGTHS